MKVSHINSLLASVNTQNPNVIAYAACSQADLYFNTERSKKRQVTEMQQENLKTLQISFALRCAGTMPRPSDADFERIHWDFLNMVSLRLRWLIIQEYGNY